MVACAVPALELMERLRENPLWTHQLSKLKQEDWCQHPSWQKALQDILAELSAGQGADQTLAHRASVCFPLPRQACHQLQTLKSDFVRLPLHGIWSNTSGSHGVVQCMLSVL